MGQSLDLMTSTSAAALNTAPKRRVWRAKLTSKELTNAGFDDGDANALEVIKGILRLKGIPEHYLADGAPFKVSERPWGLTLEFE